MSSSPAISGAVRRRSQTADWRSCRPSIRKESNQEPRSGRQRGVPNSAPATPARWNPPVWLSVGWSADDVTVNRWNVLKRCYDWAADESLCPQERFSAADLSFLLDELDTVIAYENEGKNNEQRQQGHDPLMSALDNLNRVQQLEIIHGTQNYKNYT